MKSFLGISIWSASIAAAFAALPDAAQAGIDACGEIHVEASAQCEVVPPGATCEGMCTPVSVRAACSAQLAADCRVGCDELPSVSCSASCEASCQADCTVDPGEFDCEAACEADCGGECAARCEGDGGGGECEASCKGSCSASCDSHCDVSLPEADCEAGCEASCEGSCEADANFDCQADCQAEARVDCEADVQGGCEVECKTQEGALFCDGEYIDHGDRLEECIAALEASLDIEVEGEATGSSSCEDSSCMAEGEASGRVRSDCSTAAPGGASRDLAWAGVGLALVGLTLRRRRSGYGP